MGKKFDKLCADIQAEIDNDDKKPQETPQETPQEQPQETPQEQPQEQPEEHREEPQETPQEQPQETPEEHQPRQIPDDPMKRAEYSFRRQLGRQKDKYEFELKARDGKYEKLAKEFEEFKKQHPVPQEKPKTREDFEYDEDYLKYLNDKAVSEALAKRDEEAAKQKAEDEKKRAEQEQEMREIQERQQAWVSNVNEAFGGDNDRRDKFFKRVQYCNERGLGEVLDQCPVASDYLFNDPHGPIVFEKMLNDRATFERVFNTRRTSPMAMYYELRRIEDELTRPAPEAAPAAANAAPKMMHLGKPGKQAGSVNMQGDMFDDPKALRAWMRAH